MNNVNNSKSYGKVIAVRGSVVDVFFEKNLPAINHIVKTGEDFEIILEVHMQLDDKRVRCVALNPTQGLERGMNAISILEPLKVPVGPEVLGHMFDVFGNPLDLHELPEDLERRSIHNQPPPLSERAILLKFLKLASKPSMYYCPWKEAVKLDYLVEQE